jgi:hypothetical protein
MAIGLLGIGYGFLMLPKILKKLKKFYAESHGGHGVVESWSTYFS